MKDVSIFDLSDAHINLVLFDKFGISLNIVRIDDKLHTVIMHSNRASKVACEFFRLRDNLRNKCSLLLEVFMSVLYADIEYKNRLHFNASKCTVKLSNRLVQGRFLRYDFLENMRMCHRMDAREKMSPDIMMRLIDSGYVQYIPINDRFAVTHKGTIRILEHRLKSHLDDCSRAGIPICDTYGCNRTEVSRYCRVLGNSTEEFVCCIP